MSSRATAFSIVHVETRTRRGRAIGRASHKPCMHAVLVQLHQSTVCSFARNQKWGAPDEGDWVVELEFDDHVCMYTGSMLGSPCCCMWPPTGGGGGGGSGFNPLFSSSPFGLPAPSPFPSLFGGTGSSSSSPSHGAPGFQRAPGPRYAQGLIVDACEWCAFEWGEGGLQRSQVDQPLETTGGG